MSKSNKFSPEVRERAMRMVQEHRGEYPSLWAASSTTIACLSPSATFRPLRPRQTTTGNSPIRPSPRLPDLSQMASAEPGLIQCSLLATGSRQASKSSSQRWMPTSTGTTRFGQEFTWLSQPCPAPSAPGHRRITSPSSFRIPVGSNLARRQQLGAASEHDRINGAGCPPRKAKAHGIMLT